MNPEIITALAVLIGAVSGAIALLMKTQAEVRRLSQSMETVTHELKPNGGSSLMDAVNRTEASVKDVVKQIHEIRNDTLQLKKEQGRLANVDVQDRAKARDDHAVMWYEINHLKRWRKFK